MNRMLRRRLNNNTQGFTILEVLVVVIIAGILAALAGPGWFGYLSRRRISDARENVYQALIGAQSKAQQQSTSYQLSIRENADDIVEWAVHPVNPDNVLPSLWEQVSVGIEINDATDLPLDTTRDATNPPHYVRFDYRGSVEDTLGQLTLSSTASPATDISDPTAKSIFIETLLGTLRKD